MYYKRLRKILAEKEMTIKELCDAVGFSEGGFYQMVKNNSFKVATFEIISKHLDIPMTYWFVEDHSKATGISEEDRFKIQTISFLNDKIIDLKEKNSLLQRLVRELEEKCENIKR